MTNTTQSKWFFWLLAAGSVMVSGCSSISSRGEAGFYPGAYPGVRYHAAEYAEGQSRDHPFYEAANVPPRMAAMIDWPFSFALDTVLLPWDFSYWALHKDKKAGRLPNPQGGADGGQPSGSETKRESAAAAPAAHPERWTPIMRTLLIVLSIALIGCRHERPDAKKVTLGVYVVSEQRIEPARFIDTPDFPRYGYIHLVPELAITRLQAAGTNTINSTWNDEATGQVERMSTPGAFFALFPEEARSLAELERQHIGKHNLLFVLGDIPLGQIFLSASADGPDSIPIPTGLSTNYVPLRAHQNVQQVQRDLSTLIRH